MWLISNTGKHVQASYNWFWFYLRLDMTATQDFLANYKAEHCKTKAIMKLLSKLN